MAARDEVVKTLAAVFVVREEKWDNQNYPYHSDLSIWEDHLQAHDALVNTYGKTDKRDIVLRHINVLSSGKVVYHNIRTLFEHDEWISPDHDPRASDPEFREYLRLKEIYGDDKS